MGVGSFGCPLYWAMPISLALSPRVYSRLKYVGCVYDDGLGLEIKAVQGFVKHKAAQKKRIHIVHGAHISTQYHPPRSFNPDIIHCSSPGLMLLAATLYARTLHRPLVLSYHTHLPAYLPKYKLGFLVWEGGVKTPPQMHYIASANPRHIHSDIRTPRVGCVGRPLPHACCMSATTTITLQNVHPPTPHNHHPPRSPSCGASSASSMPPHPSSSPPATPFAPPCAPMPPYPPVGSMCGAKQSTLMCFTQNTAL